MVRLLGAGHGASNYLARKRGVRTAIATSEIHRPFDRRWFAQVGGVRRPRALAPAAKLRFMEEFCDAQPCWLCLGGLLLSLDDGLPDPGLFGAIPNRRTQELIFTSENLRTAAG